MDTQFSDETLEWLRRSAQNGHFQNIAAEVCIQLEVSDSEIEIGEEITISWDVENASSVNVRSVSNQFPISHELSGEITYRLWRKDKIIIKASSDSSDPVQMVQDIAITKVKPNSIHAELNSVSGDSNAMVSVDPLPVVSCYK